MKRITIFLLTVLTVFMLTACQVDTYVITFVHYDDVKTYDKAVKGESVKRPNDPVRDQYEFEFWHLEGSDKAYGFETPVTSDVTLFASWRNEVPINPNPNPDSEDKLKIDADIDAVTKMFRTESRYQLNLPKQGPINKSRITWTFNSKYITVISQ